MIDQEDPKNPYTDDILAGMLKTSRNRVTTLRKVLNIPNSNERRRTVLLEEMRAILEEAPSITNTELTKRLQLAGYQLSRFIVGQTRQYLEEFEKEEQEPTIAYNQAIAHHDSGKMEPGETSFRQGKGTVAFDGVIGASNSLKEQIRQVQAAVMYPPNGLNILICGEAGVGKSSLVEAIFSFGKESGRFDDSSSLIVLNCADYADNPQLLLSQLFGHVKGAYTGAEANKEGLVKKADRGILFLDEVHRLPPEGQEKLFYLLDTGKYRRLGETEVEHSAQVMLIAATTENIESALLLTFRRRIPVVIELPSLADRPMQERYELIYYFAVREAAKLNAGIFITRDAVKALLVYDCPGNIGQLKNDIQVACARAYLKYLTGHNPKVRIGLLELPFFVNSQLLLAGSGTRTLARYAQGDLSVNPDDAKMVLDTAHSEASVREDLYQYIDMRMHQLRKQNVPAETIRMLIGDEVKEKFSQVSEYLINHEGKLDFEEITRSFEPSTLESIYIVRDLLNRRNYPDSDVFYWCLGMHLNAAFTRLRNGNKIYNPNLEQIRQSHPKEFQVAQEAVRELEKYWNLEIGEDECGFLTMYFQMLSPDNKQDARIGTVIVTHGNVASNILKVVEFMKVASNIRAIDMDLTERPESVMARVEEAALEVNRGKGILLLIDMGSLVHLGGIISEKHGVPVRVVDRVDTVMAIHAMEKISEGYRLEDVARLIRRTPLLALDQQADPKKERAVLTICVTGEGAALTLRKMLETAFENTAWKDVPIIPIGYLNDKNLMEEIGECQRQYDIVATVGTINPNLAGITFISLQEIMEGKGLERLYRNLSAAYDNHDGQIPETLSIPGTKLTGNLFDPSLIRLYEKSPHKGQVIEDLCRAMIAGGYVTDQYAIDIYKRELLGPTVYKGRIAIPHGLAEHVLIPSIGVAVLREPVEWSHDVPVKMVFLLALPEDCHEIMISLCRLFDNEALMGQIFSRSDPEEIRNMLTEAMYLREPSALM